MYLVDMHSQEGERYLLAVDAFNPPRCSVVRASNPQIAEFIDRIRGFVASVSEIPTENAA